MLIWSIINNKHNICPRSSDIFYIVSYYIKWVTTSLTYNGLLQAVIQRGKKVSRDFLLEILNALDVNIGDKVRISEMHPNPTKEKKSDR